MLGLALSGGGVKGAAHIGVLQALEEEGIKIDCISGTSSGSIIATLYAVGYKPPEILKIFKNYSKSIKYYSLNNIMKLIQGLTTERKITISGLNDGSIIEQEIEKLCKTKGIKYINEIKMPIIIPAVNLKDGSVILFSSKENKNIRTYQNNYIFKYDVEIAKCVRASTSFPGIFEPLEYENYKLIDGGTRENTPWRELKSIGATKVICVAFFEDIDTHKEYNNFIDVVSSSLDIMRYELENYELYKSDYIIKINTNKTSLLDTSKIEELYNIGYNETKKNIRRIKEILSNKN